MLIIIGKVKSNVCLSVVLFINEVGSIVSFPPSKDNEVDRMFPLNPGRLPIASGPGASAIQNIIFLVRPKLELMDIVADCIRKTEEVGSRFHKDYNIYFVPMKSTLCCNKLKVSVLYDTL